ncbi:hypothetical protein [Rubinisphaera sp.]|uniref:hypothetical protein n=1 Tax=Rubinisphaera sp. TaxID=2024857 RepID=UPI000C0CFFAD|nr:hypothetical protein [Rubinisphaera sp.]MBV08127.1 hypothetical protein [Rubinisphaera sp.]HCS54259.1 hypothetical protein [Planctomycetaceae bacterium]|tara:strand:- start:1353 stop:1670 length:318 start_codon:yes stop_codon:yes gene_type:complete
MRLQHQYPEKFRILFCTFCLTIAFSPIAKAEDWAFQRSYYSHALTPEVAAVTPEPYYRSAYRTPYKSIYPGGTVRSSFRINRLHLQSGFSRDSQYIYEGTVEFRP